MNNDQIVMIMRKTPIFNGMSRQQLDLIIFQSKQETYQKGGRIIEEGEVRDEVYLILSGTAEVIRHDREKNITITLSLLNPGELIGELALIDSFPRSASVVAKSTLYLLKLPFVREQLEENLGIYKGLLRHLSIDIAHKLRYTNDHIVNKLTTKIEGLAYRQKIGTYFFLLLILLSSWSLSTIFSNPAVKNTTSHMLISWAVLLGVAWGTFYHLKESLRPPQFYGIAWGEWKKNIPTMLGYTAPPLLFFLTLKLLINLIYPESSNFSLVAYFCGMEKIAPFWETTLSAIYLLTIPLQELFVRGVLQTSVKELLSDDREFWPIFLPNIFFAIIVASFSPQLALFAFLPCCFFSWLRYHQDSLLGPLLAHLLTAGWLLYFL